MMIIVSLNFLNQIGNNEIFQLPLHILKGELMLLNEATFLDNLKTRYYKDKIYVSFKKSFVVIPLPDFISICRHMWQTF